MIRSTCCIIQDPLTRRVVAMRWEERGLNKLNHMSFSPVEITAYLDEMITLLPTFKIFINTMLSITEINEESLFSAHSLCIILTLSLTFMKD